MNNGNIKRFDLSIDTLQELRRSIESKYGREVECINDYSMNAYRFVLRENNNVTVAIVPFNSETGRYNQIQFNPNINEELRYSIRSILQYIPWIRKIFILMPNKKVKFLKSINKIKGKIIYVKDKDFLGYDSANIHAFTFNLYKMNKFGISKNFIYMEDDFFIGKPLKKTDFFYYDAKKQKVFPYLLNSCSKTINKSKIINDYYNILKYKHSIHPHSNKGWRFSILSTYKYFIDRYNITLIGIKYTHNAMGENIDDIKEIFEVIKDYEYINETLLSKERHILTLNQPYFYNLYQLNINHRKVHPIPYKYIRIETVNKANLNKALFVINTGRHKPTKKQYKIQKIIMEKRFPNPSKYEKIAGKDIIIKNLYIVFFHIIFVFIKLLKKTDILNIQNFRVFK